MHKIAIVTTLLIALPLVAQEAPRYEVDPTWPKPLPEGWTHGRVGGVCVDSHDHIVIVDRRDITEEESEYAVPTPPIVMFDTTGDVIASWGDPDVIPINLHGCSFDTDDNVWIPGNMDGMIQKYSHDGDLLMQIGTRGVLDTSDGTVTGQSLNSSRDSFFRPSQAVAHPDTGDIYVSDGYGNRRVAVFNENGEFLRQWGRQATDEEIRAGTPSVFAGTVHCIAISHAGLVYVCDRYGNRLQVFDRLGNYVRSIWVDADKPASRGNVWSVAFSPDAEQRYLYVANGGREQVHILDHESGEILSTFGRPGHQIGNFTHAHHLAADSAGNIYVAETSVGRRVQRFKPVPGR